MDLTSDPRHASPNRSLPGPPCCSLEDVWLESTLQSEQPGRTACGGAKDVLTHIGRERLVRTAGSMSWPTGRAKGYLAEGVDLNNL